MTIVQKEELGIEFAIAPSLATNVANNSPIAPSLGGEQIHNQSTLYTEEDMAWASRASEYKRVQKIYARTFDSEKCRDPKMEVPPLVSIPADLMYDATPATVAQDLLSAPVALIDQLAATQVYQLETDPFAPQPAPVPSYKDIATNTYNDIASNIMSNYTPAPSNQEFMSSLLTSQKMPAAQMVPTSQPTAKEMADVPATQEEVSELSNAFRNLVNLEDINAKPEEKFELMLEKLQKSPFAERNVVTDKKMKGSPPRSRAIAPTAVHDRSLEEAKSKAAPRALSKEVMRASAIDPAVAQVGVMVVHGQTMLPQTQRQHQGYYGQQYAYGQGPPPLQQGSSGFGVGAQLVGGGYVRSTAYSW